MGVTEENRGVARVGATEDDGSGGHGGGSFSGEIRPGVARVDLVSTAVRAHVLRSLPAVMVTVPVSHLTTQPNYHPPTMTLTTISF